MNQETFVKLTQLARDLDKSTGIHYLIGAMSVYVAESDAQKLLKDMFSVVGERATINA